MKFFGSVFTLGTSLIIGTVSFADFSSQSKIMSQSLRPAIDQFSQINDLGSPRKLEIYDEIVKGVHSILFSNIPDKDMVQQEASQKLISEVENELKKLDAVYIYPFVQSAKKQNNTQVNQGYASFLKSSKILRTALKERPGLLLNGLNELYKLEQSNFALNLFQQIQGAKQNIKHVDSNNYGALASALKSIDLYKANRANMDLEQRTRCEAAILELMIKKVIPFAQELASANNNGFESGTSEMALNHAIILNKIGERSTQVLPGVQIESEKLELEYKSWEVVSSSYHATGYLAGQKIKDNYDWVRRRGSFAIPIKLVTSGR